MVSGSQLHYIKLKPEASGHRTRLYFFTFKNRHFINQDRINKLIYGINTIIKCGTWQSVKFQLASRSCWWRFTAAKFTIRNFYNPSSQNCKPNNFLKSSSILTLMSLNSAFKHVSLLQSGNYKERPNIQNKENFKLLKK